MQQTRPFSRLFNDGAIKLAPALIPCDFQLRSVVNGASYYVASQGRVELISRGSIHQSGQNVQYATIISQQIKFYRHKIICHK